MNTVYSFCRCHAREPQKWSFVQVKKLRDDKVKSADYQSSAPPNKPHYPS